MLPNVNILAALECLLFVAGEPVPAARLSDCLGVETDTLIDSISALQSLYIERGQGLQIREVAGGYQMCTRPEYADYIKVFLQPEIPALSRAALETLAIIAYRQPVTRAEIEYIRGVKVGGVLNTLLNRKLILGVGRKETPGRPILYGTTRQFLELLNIKDLNQLPLLKEIPE